MRIYDVTFPISELTPIYDGDPPVRIETASAIARGASANVTEFCIGAHTATHVDAPNHFIEGARKVDELALAPMIGRCRVVEIARDVTAITEKELEDLPEDARRVLFKTRNSAFWNEPEKGFRRDFTFIAPAAARLLVEKNVVLVGIDYLSVEEFGSEDFPTHKILLEREIVIVEGLDLREVPAGEYEIFCLPLKLISKTGDGAPARVVLREI